MKYNRILLIALSTVYCSCTAPKELAVDLGADQRIAHGDEIVLGANLEGKYTWSTGEQTKQVTITQPGTYWVRVENDEGSGSDTVQVLQGYHLGSITTNVGEVVFWLYPETPNHRRSFITLARGNYWDSLTFNRVIPDFVAQGGCPDTPAGFSDSPYLLEPEFHPDIRHIYGAVGAGRDDNPGKLSAGCQFYIVQDKDGIPRLDDNYTIFGQVLKGMDIVDNIVGAERDDRDQPLTDITLDIKVLTLTAEELEKDYGFNLSN